MTTLSERLKELRGRNNFNQRELAKRAGVNQAAVSRIENGKLSDPKMGLLKKLAECLGVSVDYLIDASRPLAPNELITSDPLAQEIVMDYQKLSQNGKRQVRDFVKFLINEESQRRIELIRKKTSEVIERGKRNS